jgi:DNA mismatch repair protein MutS
LEQSLFTELQVKVSMETAVIQDIAKSIAALDCLLSFAEISQIYNYCEPVVDDSNILEIEEGRHPVVERLLQIGEKFTPNSTYLEPEKETIHIITGPNMSGKSCYLRQVGLIVLLAQIGCYVPAKSARVGIVDRIFTRVGAQDNITAGESTFLVEMQEAANIMNNASSKSLILLDEVGRGTATFDGISIAWAIAEYINNNIDAKTLFATHYHELNDLAEKYESIANYCVEVLELDKNILFTHKVKAGASNHSFGIHVAKMAGLPLSIINRADEILKSLEGTYQGEIKTESINKKKHLRNR